MVKTDYKKNFINNCIIKIRKKITLKDRKQINKWQIESKRKVASSLHKLFSEINDEKTIVVVEGKRDFLAIKSLGYRGKIFQLCGSGKGTGNLASELSFYKKVIIMLDYDKKGESLTKSIIEKLSYGGVTIDLNLRKKVREIAKGVDHIEDLKKFSQYLVQE